MKDQLLAYRYKLIKQLHAHQTFVVLLAALIVLLAVFLRISSLGSTPVDQEYLNQTINTLKPVSFNEEAVKQIEALKDSNVNDPGTQLPPNRQNPFNE